MKGNGKIAILLLLIIAAGLPFVSGCAVEKKYVRYPLNEWKYSHYHITCNVSGAQVLTITDNILGECPLEGKIGLNEAVGETSSPYPKMLMFENSTKYSNYTKENYPVQNIYLVGKIVAPGYKPKAFRELVGFIYGVGGSSFYIGRDFHERILINAYLEPVTSPTKVQPGPQQQQQQQQQSIVIQGTEPSSTIERGIAMITSTPQYVEIYVDGAFIGNSPANLRLSEGIHILEAKKTGFKPYKKELRIIGSSELNVRITLEKK